MPEDDDSSITNITTADIQKQQTTRSWMNCAQHDFLLKKSLSVWNYISCKMYSPKCMKLYFIHLYFIQLKIFRTKMITYSFISLHYFTKPLKKKVIHFYFFEYVGFLVPPPYSAHVKTLAWNECYRRGCGLYYMCHCNKEKQYSCCLENVNSWCCKLTFLQVCIEITSQKMWGEKHIH